MKVSTNFEVDMTNRWRLTATYSVPALDTVHDLVTLTFELLTLVSGDT